MMTEADLSSIETFKVERKIPENLVSITKVTQDMRTTQGEAFTIPRLQNYRPIAGPRHLKYLFTFICVLFFFLLGIFHKTFS